VALATRLHSAGQNLWPTPPLLLLLLFSLLDAGTDAAAAAGCCGGYKLLSGDDKWTGFFDGFDGRV